MPSRAVPTSHERAGPREIVHAERELRMAADRLEVDHARDVHARGADLPSGRRESLRPVREADDEDRLLRARVTGLAEEAARPRRVVHDEAHVRAAAAGLRADRVDADLRVAEQRRELPEFSGAVRQFDVELDHPLRVRYTRTGLQSLRPPNGGAGLIDPVPLTPPIPIKYTPTYVGVQVRDLDRSIAFYRDAL